jgi:hypothetical protein
MAPIRSLESNFVVMGAETPAPTPACSEQVLPMERASLMTESAKVERWFLLVGPWTSAIQQRLAARLLSPFQRGVPSNLWDAARVVTRNPTPLTAK